MQQIKPNQVEVLELTIELSDGTIRIFQFIDQLLTKVHDEINWSGHGIGMSIVHTCQLIDEARRNHKATRHYQHHVAELMRLYDTFVAVNEDDFSNQQDSDLRELEMAA